MTLRMPTLEVVVARLMELGLKPARDGNTTAYLSGCVRCRMPDCMQVIPTPESGTSVRLWCRVCEASIPLRALIDFSEAPMKPDTTPAFSQDDDEALVIGVPVLHEAALHGKLGEFVRLCAPHTEASPAGLLATSLAAVGALLGRETQWTFGDSEHHPRLFVLLVGGSGRGRKGGAINAGARRLLRLISPEFHEQRVVSGLSSAEGIIEVVRDATPDRNDRYGKPIFGDPGVGDKRCLVIEDEFGSVLRVMVREGNRLSPVLRAAWDGQNLQTLTKSEARSATKPHICLIGAITSDELRTLLGPDSIRNG